MPEQQLTLYELQRRKKKFIVGLILIVISLAMGKLVLIPLIVFPGDKAWYTTMITVYLFSWAILIPGTMLAGIEGYRLVHHKYREYHNKTIEHVKRQSKRASEKMKELKAHTASQLKTQLQRIKKNKVGKQA